MNQLVETTSAICKCEVKDVAPQIMTICRAVTPQFYKGMADVDVKAERLSIELLTSNIEQECLAEMCRLAILNYPRSRSENPKAYFDINYILTFYKDAFNKVFCKQVELPKKSSLIKCDFDFDTYIVTETWKSPEGKTIVIKEIKNKAEDASKQITHSSKYYASLYSDFSDGDVVI